MTELRELYKCDICGNVVEIVFTGAPALVCCNQPMGKLESFTEDAGNEKHVPVVEEIAEGIRVKVGSVEHPMEEKHYIAFIEVLTKDSLLRKELKAGEKPEGVFKVQKEEIIEVRSYCNIHKLWKNID